MRRSLSMLAAAVIALTGASASFAPAQAAPVRAAPAVLDQSGPAADIVQVHRKKRYVKRYYPHYSYYKAYPRKYVKRRYVHPYAYHPYPYGYRRPGVTFQFSFGGSSHGYPHW